MFNFKNSNSGKIRVKLLATFLVLTLTFANFSLLGSYIGQAIAAEINLSNQTTETQSANVEFNVYLDEYDSTVREKTENITSEEVLLYVSVNVQEEGYLENAVIELVDTNFKFKNIPELTSVKLSDMIQSEDGISVGIPIVAKNDELYNLSLLNMQSQIRLTAEYIDEQGYVTPIDTTKAVKITWTSNEINEEDIFLSQEVITNKIYNINGTDKRVVQLLVKSKIQENKVPVESSILEITNPQIGETTLVPVDVKVASYGTEATNGKSIYSSTSENGKTIISVLNDKEQNIVSWKKNAEDIFVVTYICDYSEGENVELSTFISDVKNIVKIYGATEENTLEKTNQLPLELVQETGNIVNLETFLSKDIYKGKMYIGEDTTYQEKSILYVPYSQVVNEITIEDLSDTALTAKEEGEEPNAVSGISTYYKTTKINKADAIKVLGANGTITIYNTEDKTTPIQTINLDTEETEEDYYTVSYDTNVNKISILLNAVQDEKSEGTIEIINEKAIKVTNTEVVLNAAQLKTNKNLLVTDSVVTNGATNTIQMVNLNSTDTSNLFEPKTTFNIAIDKKSLSTQVENDLRLTVELIAKDESNKLFKGTEENPVTIDIELPAEVVDATIENMTHILGNDELERTYELITNEAGNKVIAIKLTGSQTEYLPNTSTITIDLKVKTNKFMSDKDVAISATCVNNGETAISKENISIVSKPGLITKNKLTIGETIIEEINQNNISANITENTNANITTAIMNNFGEDISNVSILGNIPNGITLTNAISSNTNGVTISYSEDSRTWTSEVTDFSKIKAFKITLEEIKNSEAIDLTYDIIASTEIQDNITLENALIVNYEINEQAKQESIVFTLNAIIEDETETPEEQEKPADPEQPTGPEEKVLIEIVPKTLSNTLHEGQILTYQIKLKNISGELLNNLKLEYTIPEGAVATELTYAQGVDVTFTDDESIKKKIWEIDTLSSNQTISKEVTIRIKKGTTQIVNTANLKDTENLIIAQITTETQQVVKGELTVQLSRADNMSMDLGQGSQIKYYIAVTNNTNSAIENIVLKSKIHSDTTFVEGYKNNQDWTYSEQTREVTQKIDSISVGETIIKELILKVNSISNDFSEVTIENTAVAIYNQKEYESNLYTNNILKPSWEIQMTSEHSETLNIGDSVKYIIKVTNVGERSFANVQDILPEEIQLRKLTYYIRDNKKVDNTITDNDINIIESVDRGETLTIEIEGVILDIEDSLRSKQITNVSRISLGREEYLESNAITNTILNGKTQQGTGNNNSSNTNKEGTISISGLVWNDENKDGIRDNNEKTLEAIEVILLDKEGNQIANTLTSITGTYKFNNVEKGEYTVAFKYDTTKYVVSKYQVSKTTQETNSDVISKNIKMGDKEILVAITDTIKAVDKNITNIDMGLVENPEFDLSLNKYISKVVVSNNKETKTYEYENTQLAKVEISAKQLVGSNLLVEYEIEVVNNGDINGYVTDIIDYLPKQLEFNSEMNTEWYLGTDNYLHYMALDPQVIEPGKTQTVKLVLTKTLKSNSTGTIENTAEIAEGVNLEGMLDIDSIANNQKDGEDDISKASLIVSISTGSPIMYIGIVIGNILVLGFGVYIINKKVLKVRI